MLGPIHYDRGSHGRPRWHWNRCRGTRTWAVAWTEGRGMAWEREPWHGTRKGAMVWHSKESRGVAWQREPWCGTAKGAVVWHGKGSRGREKCHSLNPYHMLHCILFDGSMNSLNPYHMTHCMSLKINARTLYYSRAQWIPWTHIIWYTVYIPCIIVYGTV